MPNIITIDLDDPDRYRPFCSVFDLPADWTSESGYSLLYRVMPSTRAPEGGFLLVGYRRDAWGHYSPVDFEAVDAETANNWLAEHRLEPPEEFREALKVAPETVARVNPEPETCVLTPDHAPDPEIVALELALEEQKRLLIETVTRIVAEESRENKEPNPEPPEPVKPLTFDQQRLVEALDKIGCAASEEELANAYGSTTGAVRQMIQRANKRQRVFGRHTSQGYYLFAWGGFQKARNVA